MTFEQNLNEAREWAKQRLQGGNESEVSQHQQGGSVAIAEGKAGRTGGDKNGEPGARQAGDRDHG